MAENYVHIVGHVEHTTHRAILVKSGRDDKRWIPRWAVKNGGLTEKDDLRIEVSEKWLVENGEEGRRA